MTPEVRVVEADLADPGDAADLVALLDTYARDAEGRRAPLPAVVRARLPGGLRDHGRAFALLARDARAGTAVGLAVCFEGYSTFAARPLVNLHDLVVHPAWRRRGVGARLLEAVEEAARRRGACRITLEVHGSNGGARALYRRTGFRGDAAADGPVYFLEKPLAG